jgi:FkbM family methyltransferase
MKFIKKNILIEKFEGIVLRILYWLGNINNSNIETNGEKKFLSSFLNDAVSNEKLIVFDVGANVGDYTFFLVNYAKKKKIELETHLFEPTKSCFEILKNKFNKEQYISLNQFGLSNQKEKKTLYYDKETSGLASLYKRNLEFYETRLDLQEEITLQRLDHYIKENGILHIHLLKIDIEGHELFALEGLGLYLDPKFIDMIQFEYGGANLDSKTSLLELYTLFEKHGFSVARIMKKGLKILPYSPTMENFQYANYVAISDQIIKIK